ncbi:hypothetical protein [Sedimenticola selenatireducens]|uniref:hypothetical protein n=1 Tax=Sedimenticola selenatireducens TaxID=191960 RepID=UPI0012F83529|nr:hypothetical protein [Sedimenticola selenatireducens]
MFEIANIPDDKLRSLLPNGIKNLLGKRVSLSGILWLIKTYGGTDIYIPSSTSDASARFTGLSSTDIHHLCQLAGGTDIKIPSGVRIKQYLFSNRVVEMRKAGISERDVALALGIADRSVRRIVQQADWRLSIKQTQEPQ